MPQNSLIKLAALLPKGFQGRIVLIRKANEIAAEMRTARDTVIYKGRPYRLLWKGRTRYGERAHLQFMDGTKDFWVDASNLDSSGPSSGGRGRKCDNCGKSSRRLQERQDSSGLWGEVCSSCARMPFYERSFA